MGDQKNSSAARQEQRVRDKEIAMQAATGEPGAQRVLVNLLFDRIRNLCTYLAGVDCDPDDLAQNAMVAILRSVGSFKGESSLSRWADRVAVHTFYKVVEKRTRREKLWGRHAHNIRYATYCPEEQATSTAVRQRLAALMGTLPKERRTAMILHHVEGYSIEEISQMTQTLPNTVRDRLQVARNELKEKVFNDPLLSEWRREKM